MDDVAVEEVDRYGLVLAAHTDQLAFKAPLLPEGAVRERSRPVSAGERQNDDVVRVGQFPGRIVLAEQLVEVTECLQRILRAVAGPHPLNTFAHLWLRRFVDTHGQHSRSCPHPIEMDMGRFTEKPCERSHILGQPLHREVVRRIAVSDAEPVIRAHGLARRHP